MEDPQQQPCGSGLPMRPTEADSKLVGCTISIHALTSTASPPLPIYWIGKDRERVEEEVCTGEKSVRDGLAHHSSVLNPSSFFQSRELGKQRLAHHQVRETVLGMPPQVPEGLELVRKPCCIHSAILTQILNQMQYYFLSTHPTPPALLLTLVLFTKLNAREVLQNKH